jgi:hypothetical protein
MPGIQSLFNEIKKIKDEIRDLNGRLQRIVVGGQVIPGIPGTTNVPPAVLGAMIVGNATPAWERKEPPTITAGQEYELTFNDGDTQPQWRLQPSATGKYRMFTYTVNPVTPDFTFIVDSGGNPVFVLQDLE